MRTTPRSRSLARLLLAASVLGAVALPSAAAPALAAPSSSPTPSASSPAKAGTTGAAADKKKLQTYGIGPASKTALDRRGTFVYSGKPGTVIKDHVALVNYTTKPQQAKVYASDAFTTTSGAFDVLAATEKSKDVGSWTDIEARTVTIPGRKKATDVQPGTLIVPFTLTVPARATAGDHAGGIVLSVRTKAAEGTNSVVVDRRVGTRIYVRVAGPLDPSLGLAGLSVSYDGTPNPVGNGSTRIKYTVRNTGNVVLSARQNVQVKTWFNTALPAAQPADLVQLLPGAAVNMSVDVDGVWPTFRPAATVTLVPYTGTADAPVDLKPVSATTHFWAIPWTLIAIVVALLLALLGWFVWRRRRRPRPMGAHASPPAPELVGAAR